MADIFISHSSEDSVAAGILRAWLARDRPSWSVFLAPDPRGGVRAGEDWQQRLRMELLSCRLVVALVTRDWTRSQWCFVEAVVADFEGKDFVAVLPETLSESAEDHGPPILHRRQRLRLNLSDGAGWNELLRALDRSGLDPDQWFPLSAGVGPYPGFVAFEERDAGVFFGRSREVTAYLGAVNSLRANGRPQVLLVSGGSGCGKSSLLKAGLLPRLRRQREWLVLRPIDPFHEPLHSFVQSIREAGTENNLQLDLPEHELPSGEELLRLVIHALRTLERATDRWLFLPIDQVEALLQDDPESSPQLLGVVGELLSSRDRRLVGGLTIRTEFTPALERVLPAGVQCHDMRLRAMDADGFGEVIERPADRFGIELEPGLASRLVQDTKHADSLPLLAYTLRELYDRYGRNRRLSLEAYGQLGGVERAIEKNLIEALSAPALTPEQLSAFRRFAVRHLVRCDDTATLDAQYLRRPAPRSRIPAEAAGIVERLREARLIVDSGEGAIVFAHDRMIRDWDRLPMRRWLEEDARDRRFIQALELHLAAWRDMNGPLLAGRLLRDSEALLLRDPELARESASLADFVERSAVRRREKAVAARARRARAECSESRYRAEQARQALARELPATAVQLALAGLPDDPEAAGARPWVEETASVLVAALPLLCERSHRAWGGSVEGLSREGRRAAVRHLNGYLIEAVGRDEASGFAVVQYPSRLECVAFSPDGGRLVCGAGDGSVLVWDIEARRAHRVLTGHVGAITAVAFSRDGERLVSASGGHLNEAITIRIWEAETGKELAVAEGHTNRVGCVAFVPDGRSVVSGSWDQTVRIWDTESGREVAVLRTGELVCSIAVSPDGAVFASGHPNDIRLWNRPSEHGVLGRLLGPLKKPEGVAMKGHEGDVRCMAFSADGKLLLSGSWDKTIRLWEVESGGQRQVWRGHEAPVNQVAFLSDGDVISGSSDRTVRRWDMSTARLRRELRHGSHVYVAEFSPDGQTILTASGDSRLRIWESTTGVQLLAITGHAGGLNCARFSPAGDRIVSVGEDARIQVWSSRDGSLLLRLRVETGRYGEVPLVATFSPDGSRIASAGTDSLVHVWDASSGEELFRVPTPGGGGIRAVAFSPDGRLVAAPGYGAIGVWEAATGMEVLTVRDRAAGLFQSIAFSPDGRRICGGAFGALRVWDLLDGSEGVPLRGHAGDAGIRAISYSPDGMWIASGSQHARSDGDNTVRVWDALSGDAILTLRDHGDAVFTVGWSPDGTRIVSGSNDRTALVTWVGGSKRRLTAGARARLPRDVTAEERERFHLSTD